MDVMLGGYSGTAGYLPAVDLTIAVVTTLGAGPDNRGPEAPDDDENPTVAIFKEISAAVDH